ncbi:MAG: 6-carboxytetrahydropterin synthase [Leptospirillia bacterium]
MGQVHITKRAEVATSHRCFRPDWDDRQNEAVYGIERHPHGHNYLVEATISGSVDPVTGMVANIKDLKAAMGNVLADYDHRNLNSDHPGFATTVPTSERAAEAIRETLAAALAPHRVERVRLFETDDIYFEAVHPNGPEYPKEAHGTMLITRRYQFSASHRLHSEVLSDADNQALFMDCNNAGGHGHTYTLAVTVQGDINRETGLAADHASLDSAIREAVVDRYNYTDLNDVEELKGAVTTSENIVRAIWERLEKRLGEGALYRVALGETRDNHFEYYG